MYSSPPTIISIFFVITALTGCFKSNLSGDAFITTSSGAVAPLAGKKVHLIPNANSDEIFISALKTAQSTHTKQIDGNIISQCELGLSNIKKVKLELSGNVQELDTTTSLSAPTCSGVSALINEDLIVRENEIVDDLNALENLKSLRKDVIDNRILAMKAKEFDKVKVSLGKMRLESRNQKRYEYSVIIDNKSDYCLTGKAYEDLQQNKTDSFVFAFKRDDINIDSSFIAPLNPKDANGGFLCGVPPKTKRKLFVSVSNTGMRIAEELHKKYGFPLNGNEKIKYIEPDTVELFQHSFVENGFIVENGKRLFVNKKINWHEKIDETTVYDIKIHDLESKISLARNEYSKLKMCSQINLLEKAQQHLPSCADSKLEPKDLYTGIMSINNLLGVKFFNTTNLHEKVVISTVENFKARFNKSDVLISEIKINGSYQFDSIPRGKYLAFIEFIDATSSVYWLHTIDIDADTNHDFNDNNLMPTGIQKYVETKIGESVNCFSCSKHEMLRSITDS